MKIHLTSKEDNGGWSGRKAHVKVNGHRDLIIPLLERALEIAQQGKWDTEIKEIFSRKGVSK
jgi:hypothetical protein